MPVAGLRSSKGMTCTRCGKKASFLSPIGTLCPTDALLAAAFNDWIPELITSFEDTGWLEGPDGRVGAQ